MREDTFRKTIRTFSRAVPFYPYTVELQNRVRLIVRHPEAIRLDILGTAVLIDTDGTAVVFDSQAVVRVVSVVIPRNAE